MSTLRSAGGIAFAAGGSAGGAAATQNKWQLWNPNAGTILALTRLHVLVSAAGLWRVRRHTAALTTLILAGVSKDLGAAPATVAQLRQENTAGSTGTAILEYAGLANAPVTMNFEDDPFLIPANVGIHFETSAASVFVVCSYEWLQFPA